MSKEKKIGIGIRKIKETMFYVNDEILEDGEHADYRVDFKNKLISKNNLLVFLFRVVYTKANSRTQQPAADVLLDSSVEYHFEVTHLDEQFDNEGYLALPEQIWMTIVEAAVNGSRAIIANRTANTKLSDALVPLVDTKDVVKTIFPAFMPEK